MEKYIVCLMQDTIRMKFQLLATRPINQEHMAGNPSSLSDTPFL